MQLFSGIRPEPDRLQLFPALDRIRLQSFSLTGCCCATSKRSAVFSIPSVGSLRTRRNRNDSHPHLVRTGHQHQQLWLLDQVRRRRAVSAVCRISLVRTRHRRPNLQGQCQLRPACTGPISTSTSPSTRCASRWLPAHRTSTTTASAAPVRRSAGRTPRPPPAHAHPRAASPPRCALRRRGLGQPGTARAPLRTLPTPGHGSGSSSIGSIGSCSCTRR